MANPPANLSFLPWVRQGAAAAISATDTLGANLPGAALLSASLSVNGTPAPAVSLRLRGPADVVGIDTRQIVRMDPHPGSAAFEPNYFAAIEFDRADFPWLFTPAKAQVGGRLRPWLCLVVVRVQPGVSVQGSADAPLPVLEIAAPAVPADELPDLAECWAWAHAQAASGAGSAQDIRDALQGRPELALSRLLCPRLLEPDTDYLACVVPTFDLGVKAGLGLEIKDSDLTSPNGLKSAWSLTPTAPASLRLPVYHQWSFRTGVGGDFESLVRLLRALPAPLGLGTRPIDISRPGFTLPDTFTRGAVLQLEGALKALNSPDLPASWRDSDALAFQTTLADIVNAPGLAQVSDPKADPLLAPPLYGRWHAARTTVTRGAAPWLDVLNLDPRHRVVAAFGTQVVQEHQEALMAAAWEQAAELQSANQRLRHLQLALVVATSLHTRHFMRLSDDAALRLAAPAFARLRGASGGATAITNFALGSALPLQATSVAMRRIGRERGPLTRRVASQGALRSVDALWTAKLNVQASASFVEAPRWDAASFESVRSHVVPPPPLRGFAEVADATTTNVFGRPVFRIAADGQPLAVQGLNTLPPSADSPTARSFRLAASAHLARINPGRFRFVFLRRLVDTQPLRASLQSQLEPRRALVALAQALVTTGSNATPIVPAAPQAPVPFEPVMAAPKFRQPMYEPLRDLSTELLLPRLDTVQPNSALGLQTNRRFVEAYMVGLNHEMGRELLWRGFPTDQRGTCFDRFWDATPFVGVASAGLQTPAGDILPLHLWADRRLGDTLTPPAAERFVLLLRSDLLRRYPSAMIYAAKAKLVGSVRMPSIAEADEAMPIFRGALPPDVSFFGFDIPIPTMLGGGADLGYFIIIQEQPGEPRFGLDVGTPAGNATHLRANAPVPAGLPLNGLQWGANAAHVAGIVRQQPVRVAIHASQFLPNA